MSSMTTGRLLLHPLLAAGRHSAVWLSMATVLLATAGHRGVCGMLRHRDLWQRARTGAVAAVVRQLLRARRQDHGGVSGAADNKTPLLPSYLGVQTRSMPIALHALVPAWEASMSCCTPAVLSIQNDV